MLSKKIITVFALAAVGFIAGCNKDDDSGNGKSVHPKVESTSPSADETNVALNKTISVNFSEEMDASTITSSSFSVKKGSTVVPGSVSYSGKTALFEPSVALDENAGYTVTISTSVKNKKGDAMIKKESWEFSTGVSMTGMATVNLRASGNYVILAKTAINNIPTADITGDVGLSPAATSYITGFSLTNATGYATSAQVTGRIYAADMAPPTSINLATAVNDMISAYNDAAGRSVPDFTELGNGNIGGKTLIPGLYKWTSTVVVPTNFVVSGSATDVWIFQIAGNLSVGSGVKMILSGGAKPENIFWQVAGEVGIGTTSEFKGVLLSMTGITLNTGATLNGRALAQSAVVLDSNIITQP
ncbi:MAG: DUF3494 domain-containing protein [Cryomorphaceae bacterium]|nr:DUF3494 domain-containing protein [Cryomorphaceae bacterium]